MTSKFRVTVTTVSDSLTRRLSESVRAGPGPVSEPLRDPGLDSDPGPSRPDPGSSGLKDCGTRARAGA
jgi:hypothetical protein